MRLTERIYMVGSGRHGSELSHSRDCNVFVVDGGEEAVLIDAGSGLAPERIVANAEQDGVAVERIKRLLLTHVHGDHAAGAKYFHDRFGIEVFVSWEAAPWLQNGDLDKTSIQAAKKAGVYPPDFHYPACPVAGVLKDRQCLAVGDLELQVLETPGHSRGHVSFMLEEGGRRSLFSGDVLFANGKIYIQNSWDCSIQEYAASIARLSRLDIERLFPGHGSCVLANGGEHILTAQQSFERLDIPPNL